MWNELGRKKNTWNARQQIKLEERIREKGQKEIALSVLKLFNIVSFEVV
jgi:hypothetical protein